MEHPYKQDFRMAAHPKVFHFFLEHYSHLNALAVPFTDAQPPFASSKTRLGSRQWYYPDPGKAPKQRPASSSRTRSLSQEAEVWKSMLPVLRLTSSSTKPIASDKASILRLAVYSPTTKAASQQPIQTFLHSLTRLQETVPRRSTCLKQQKRKRAIVQQALETARKEIY
jgi:hypothetical protein